MTEITDPVSQLKIRIIPVTPLQQNTSLLWSRATKEGVFIDLGGEADRLLAAAEHFGVEMVAVWLTHGHLDHAGAAAEIAKPSAALLIAIKNDPEHVVAALNSAA